MCTLALTCSGSQFWSTAPSGRPLVMGAQHTACANARREQQTASRFAAPRSHARCCRSLAIRPVFSAATKIICQLSAQWPPQNGHANCRAPDRLVREHLPIRLITLIKVL